MTRTDDDGFLEPHTGQTATYQECVWHGNGSDGACHGWLLRTKPWDQRPVTRELPGFSESLVSASGCPSERACALGNKVQTGQCEDWGKLGSQRGNFLSGMLRF